MGPKVIVGMSGGVDSSVAALLLKEQGYEVIGVTMQIWQDERSEAQQNCACSASGERQSADDGREDTGCCGLSAVEDARRVADHLGIPYYVMNFKREFRQYVMDYFVEEYLHGRTPNPCIACNRYVKWEALLNKSLAIGAEYIATGHYARIDRLENGRFCIRNSVTARKDQTYALYALTQDQLAHTLMPVGAYTKEQIRQMAQDAGLPVAHKKDSQEICFIPDHDYAAFIERERGGQVPGPGNFVSGSGEVLGRHKGITHYTVGQRKGLNLSMGRPVFVTAIRPETNEVVIGEGRDVFTDHLTCSGLNFMAIPDLTEPRRALAKIRYA
ncbi:MAG TPA: tRNA 2-thiouridine(34) synthase MnmA, partial [Candidatus Eisenbergiella intestinigallinarum]|nr:tRNA 2-thiouridine(34) synthase MnmA [Candidatus Eisenbergiella intestinigallinarum]